MKFIILSGHGQAAIDHFLHYIENGRQSTSAKPFSAPLAEECAARGDIAVRTKLLRLLGKGFFRLLAEDGPELRDDALKLQFP